MSLRRRSGGSSWLGIAVPALLVGLGAGHVARGADEAKRLGHDRLEAMMVSAQAETREAAYAVGRSWGAAGAGDFRRILWGAWERRESQFAKALRESAYDVGLFMSSHRNWQALGHDAMVSVRSGLGGSGEMLGALDRRFGEAEKARVEMDARLARALAAIEQLSAVGVGLVELEGVLAGVEGRDAEAVPSFKARLSADPDGRALLAAEATLLRARRTRDAHVEAAMHNREQRWASSTAQRFATLLNRRRQVLGLEPLRLERRLWEACASHTEEMRQLGYFDHKSPRPGRQTPGERAQAAQFVGTFEGENLYQSARPEALERVFRSWWASDRHRQVLFASRPNRMGLDPGGGTHWALMTGRM